jgi:FkbM family methyltransferase
MPQYYSQNGEDCLLWALFQEKTKPGYYVEVGALDGLRFSNTYSFERAGWTGVCIEAHPDYYQLLEQNRPASVNVSVAVGDHDGRITLYANARGSLSTIMPNLESEFSMNYGENFSGFTPIDIELKTLNSILNDANAPLPIDILSVDIEGAEWQALHGFDLKRYRPRVLVLEVNDTTEEDRLTSYLKRFGYLRARKIVNNVFFCHSVQDARLLAETTVDCCVIHTPHTLDGDQGNSIKHVVHRGNHYVPVWKKRYYHMKHAIKMGLIQAKLYPPPEKEPAQSRTTVHITEQAALDAFNADADNPYLVSFPRTGSHWLLRSWIADGVFRVMHYLKRTIIPYLFGRPVTIWIAMIIYCCIGMISNWMCSAAA